MRMDHLSPANLLHRSQRVFRQALKTSPRAAVAAGKILEYAYLWVLACNSCKFSLLEFDELEARFQCQDIQPGYIFQKNSQTLDSAKVAELQKATLLPRGTIRVPTFSSRMTLVLCIWLKWVAPATCRRRWTRFRKWMMFSSRKVCVRTCKWVSWKVSSCCHWEYQPGRCRKHLKSHHRHRGKSQKAAWWSRPTSCLAASCLKPKAGEPNQSQGKEGVRAKRHPKTVSKYNPLNLWRYEDWKTMLQV